jgi:hypothetical protein
MRHISATTNVSPLIPCPHVLGSQGRYGQKAL